MKETKKPAMNAKPAKPAMNAKPTKPEADKTFYIVGIGSSAGGLETLEQFFNAMPPDTGLAFVLVQHLDPTHKGFMPELLQRYTKMKVAQVRDGLKVRPDCVYIIPPNKDMSILHGTLHLLEPSTARGFRLPIDYFFRQLADDQKERGIGIILSGMGSDGTLGIKAIKEKMGMVMMQDPACAKYDSMPRNAIATGIVDYITSPAEMPAKLLAFVKYYIKRVPGEGVATDEKAVSALQKIFILLRTQTGHDFSLYKKNTLYRRIERRMGIHQIDNITHYVRYLQNNPQEIDLLFKELLIGVTSFFRDPEAFEVMKEKAIPELLESRMGSGVLRVWVTGCSTGEEAYSIAMILRECMDTLKERGALKYQVFATDIDTDAIDRARAGKYLKNITADVSLERLNRFFTKTDLGYTIKKDLRETLIFAPQNIIMDPPFTKLDILCCRNLLIYLTAELQKKLLPVFHYTLNTGGILFLGASETLSETGDLFSPIDTKWKIFKRKAAPYMRNEIPQTMLPYEEAKVRETEKQLRNREIPLSDIARQALMERYSPPAVVINEKGDILYIHGKTGKYLEPSQGKAAMNVFAMAREGLKAELGTAIFKASKEQEAVTIKGVSVKTDGENEMIDLTVMPVKAEKHADNLLMVMFERHLFPPPGKRKQKFTSTEHPVIISELKTELQYTKEHLQTIIEEMETSQEELGSVNEELQSNNEELQSTNEELTTSKEEMQSLNEELITVNAEFQSNAEELSRTHSDMINLMNATEIAVIFLDNDLNILRYTPPLTKIIHTIQTDIGRPLTHLHSNLLYGDLEKDVRQVLETLVFREIQVEAKDGQWYTMRIIPYRTINNIIEGAIVTFVDITAIKRYETLVEDARTFAENIVATVRQPLIVLDSGLTVVSANKSFFEMFHVLPQETEGKLLYSLGKRQWDIPALKILLEEILPENTQFEGFRVEYDFPDIGKKVMLLNARKVISKSGQRELILLAMEDVTGNAIKS
ncbi:MAG: PAS domain-containing protein [Proteobacteria bacterium]|nr:PAS domain-containing protein [Pseudomonadota bacterium]